MSEDKYQRGIVRMCEKKRGREHKRDAVMRERAWERKRATWMGLRTRKERKNSG